MEKILQVEKQRRQEMASLYASLRSLLPLEFIQGKRSTSDQLNEGIYRGENQGHVFQERLLYAIVRNGVSNHVVVCPCLIGVEIVFIGQRTSLSSVLQVLGEHGLCVLSCISSNVNETHSYSTG